MKNYLHENLHDTLYRQFHRHIEHIFFVGIGGSSMSGLAEMSRSLGFDVCGSDMCASEYTKHLSMCGIPVFVGHRRENLPEDTDLLVFSTAISTDNPERVQAGALGIPEIERSVFLGLLTAQYSNTVAVAGTHGKTTTSAMIASVLLYADKDPSVSIGGFYPEINGNYRIGKSGYFVAEACEYHDSFLELHPGIGIITNIEMDHLDYFTGGIEQIKDSFLRFGQLIPGDGAMICWGDSEAVQDTVKTLKCPVITYGFSDNNDWCGEVISYDKGMCAAFNVYRQGLFYGQFKLSIPGKFNVLNALAAIAACDRLQIQYKTLRESLERFGGVRRRFELGGIINGVTVVEDYAHHPTELKEVINIARQQSEGTLWVVFQPHTFSRVYYFLNEFADALGQADRIILTPIYSDREKNKWDIHIENLSEAIRTRHSKPVIVIETFEEIAEYLGNNVNRGDFVLVAGSQTINNAVPMIVKSI